MKQSLLLFFLLFTLNLKSNGQFSIGGAVRDQPFTQWMTGARVTLFNSDTTYFRETRVDVSGIYRFTNIPAGNYSLGCSFLAKEYQQVSITVAGNIFSYDFNLVPETQLGRWDIIVQSPEPLGGTDLAILQPDGKIFYCHNTIDPFAFDPVVNQTLSTMGDDTVQGCAAPLLMPDGRIVFVGGTDQKIYGPGRRKVKTYDPSTQVWQTLPDMIGNRWYPTMTGLIDGRLLIVGGGGLQNPVREKTSELYDLSTGTSQLVDTIAIGNEVSPIVMLYDGNVLMTHRPPQLFTPSTNQWAASADFLQGNRMSNGDHADHELVLLPEGNVIAIGYKSFTSGVPGNFVEKYNPITNSWSLGANFAPVRSRSKTVLLPGKNILVMAGYKEETSDTTSVNQWGYMKIADMYNPYTEQWRRLAPMNYFREYHSLPVLAPDGRVIIVGGEGQPGNEPPFSVIEAFNPPYLFRGVRPEIVNLSKNVFQRGSQITFDALKTDSITGVVLMSTPSLSHFMNCGNNRYIELPFTQTGNAVSATIPLDSLNALGGYYQMFVMVDDIPSIGKIIKVQPASSSNTATIPLRSGWNIVSIPLVVQDFRRDTLFPTSISNAFSYSGSGYQQRDTLANGAGYWLKFSTPQTVTLSGAARTIDSVDVTIGWNLIGSLSGAVPIANIVQVPSGIVVSSYYEYAGSYQPAGALLPGKGYWVKVNQSGKLILVID